MVVYADIADEFGVSSCDGRQSTISTEEDIFDYRSLHDFGNGWILLVV